MSGSEQLPRPPQRPRTHLKKVVRKVCAKAVVPHIRKTRRLSERRACAILDVNRKTLSYTSVKRDIKALRMRINAIASAIDGTYVLLRRERWLANVKRVDASCREQEGPSMGLKTPNREPLSVRRSPYDSKHEFWWGRWDLNPHELPRPLLRRLRLPFRHFPWRD